MSELNIGTEFINEGVGIGTEGISIVSGSYVGPLDLVPGADLWYGQRAATAADVANAMTLIESGGSTSQSFPTTTDNAVSIANVNTFKGVNNAFFTHLFDKSGNNRTMVRLSADTSGGWAVLPASTRPTFGPRAGVGTEPSFFVNIADDVIPTPAEMTVFFVTYINPLQTIASVFSGLSQSGGYWQCDIQHGQLDVQIYDGVAGFVQWDAFNAAITGLLIFEVTIAENGDVVVYINGVDMEAAPDDAPAPLEEGRLTGLAMDAGANAGGAACESGVYEFGRWSSVLSAPNRLALRQNIAAYYGITLP